MVIRILNFKPAFGKYLTANSTNLLKNSKRFGGGGGYVGYREPNYHPPYKWEKRAAICVGIAVWTNILYNLYYSPGHIIGEWPEPDLSAYTDEELGIPPDDAGLAPVIPNVRSTRIKGGPPVTVNKDPIRLQNMYGDTGVFKF